MATEQEIIKALEAYFGKARGGSFYNALPSGGGGPTPPGPTPPGPTPPGPTPPGPTPPGPTPPGLPSLQNLSQLASNFQNFSTGVNQFLMNSSAAIQQVKDTVDATETLLDAVSAPLRLTLQEIQDNLGGVRDGVATDAVTMGADIQDAFFGLTDLITASGDEVANISGKYAVQVGSQTKNIISEVFEHPKVLQEKFGSFLNSFMDTYATRFARDLKDSAADIALVTENFGISVQDLGNFVGREIDLTGKASTAMMDELKVASYSLSKQTGLSAKQIAQTTVEIVNSVQNFGNVTVDEAARMATALRQVGVEFSDLNAMVGKFTGFESAAQSVGNLTSVFGVQLDSMELMELANTDQEAFMHRIRDSFIDQGIAIEDMNLQQKKLLQTELGFSDIRGVERFFQEDAMSDQADLLAATTDQALSEQDAFEQFNKDMSDLALQGKKSADVIQNSLVYAFQKELAPAAIKARGNIMDVTTIIKEDLNNAAKEVAKPGGGLSQMADAVNKLNAGDIDLSQFGQQMSTGFTAVFPDVTNAFTGFLSGLTTLWDRHPLKGSSPSKAGLSLSSGFTTVFPDISAAFEVTMDNMEIAATNTVQFISENFKNLMLPDMSELTSTAQDTVGEVVMETNKQITNLNGAVNSQINESILLMKSIDNLITSVKDMTKKVGENINKVDVKVDVPDAKKLFSVVTEHVGPGDVKIMTDSGIKE